MTISAKNSLILEIVELIEQNYNNTEIIQFVAKKFKRSERQVHTYIKEAKSIIDTRNNEKEAVRVSVIKEKVLEAANEAIISDLELEAILCTIATANLSVEEILKGEAVLRGVTPNEQIAAIDKLFKKRGSNAPLKTAMTNKEGDNVAPIIIFTPSQNCDPIQ